MAAFLTEYWHIFASIGLLIATVAYMRAQLKDSRDDIRESKEDIKSLETSLKDKVDKDDCSRAHTADETLRRETQSILIKLLELGEARMNRMEKSDIRFEEKIDDIKDALFQHIADEKEAKT